MAGLRKLLFPFSIIYDLVTQTRNYLFDKQIFKSKAYNVPIIAVGNLSTGGTGKTPMIEYLIEILADQNQIATLSRGYGRKSTGYILADQNDTAKTIGDEPFQIHKKFPNVHVAVDVDRQNGIENLLSQKFPPNVILLDDAFQHRKVKAGFYILLTSFDSLYSNDLILPAGNLRESKSGANRADVVVVTKCPAKLSEAEMVAIEKKLSLKPEQKLFFSTIQYDQKLHGQDISTPLSDLENQEKLLVAGIAKPKLFFDHFTNHIIDKLQFPDHHDFSENDVSKIKKAANGNPIITTEKDFSRLKDFNLDQIYYLPIKTKIIGHAAEFEKTIKQYVGKS